MTDLTLCICRGLPGCGKTTFARAWVAEDPVTRARVNKDDLRRLLHDGVYLGRDTENTVNMIRDNMISSLLGKGISVISDDTNLPQRVVRDIAVLGRKAGATVATKDFTDVSLDTCISRDRERLEHSVGEKVIRDMHLRFLAGRTLPLPFPDADETEGASFAPYVPDTSLPDAWMVDIDGTLALMERGPFEWHRVGEDALNKPVAEVVRALGTPGVQRKPARIVVMSGRDSVCREETEEWLSRNRIGYDVLVMRPEGDKRKDSVVKHELFCAHVAPHFNVIGVFDDRDQVVRMWREIGLTCFQVAPGAF